jgi:hypothetical protein
VIYTVPGRPVVKPKFILQHITQQGLCRKCGWTEDQSAVLQSQTSVRQDGNFDYQILSSTK